MKTIESPKFQLEKETVRAMRVRTHVRGGRRGATGVSDFCGARGCVAKSALVDPFV